MKFTLLNSTSNEAILFETPYYDTSISTYWFLIMIEEGRWERTDLVNIVDGIVNDPILNYVIAQKEDKIDLSKLLLKNARSAYKKRHD